jgi:hypothetical protein
MTKRRQPTATPPRPETKRCAVYTRKSTTAGLEQDFNSLDAQREACEQYIRCQAGLGWQLIPEEYSDGGFTGANLTGLQLAMLNFGLAQLLAVLSGVFAPASERASLT